ncbi:putative histidine kinase-like ATPase domain-containing protein [Lupinus albus]|uniref:Putative histidine kinase-like ATPase domain-containing protein n=1 Tax=Lupinus albus TaxID=3870 RepID=A0A6A4PT99_LUPAL|nr:putative histidine kinase-like ATPase domain-containing protein [Lupinus albus]
MVMSEMQNMWDLTPDTDLLLELPEEYTFETALADLIDNSLQAVWSNGENDRKFIRVYLDKEKIVIFDNGPGMDDSDEKSLVKWGKIGASLHRLSKSEAIGGKPPYLKPNFGMFGFGGPIAAMHLGRRVIVSSKTKNVKKVYMLVLDREALLSATNSSRTWKSNGGIRDLTEAEIRDSNHGSFTKVVIRQPKVKDVNIFRLQCHLKDIYFPYIQSDDMFNKGRTNTPIEFQVNGDCLTEIEGGEVAITNLLSCNGPEFIVQLHLSNAQYDGIKSSNSKDFQQANARLRFVYFPFKEGKENLERVLEKLIADGYVTRENFQSFSRVSVRRLGRLLPQARWSLLPFMEVRNKKGIRGQLLKRCCLRVKCFIETDAGFKPTQSKTDLAHHNLFTLALKNFGDKAPNQSEDVDVEIRKNGKVSSLLQLERNYEDWILQMHDVYDKEVDSGEDQPVMMVSPANKKALGISSEVIRVHQQLKRKEESWKAGQKIKVLKGACAGFHKNNVYATLEYFLLEGFEGDTGDENGCVLLMDDENASLDIRGSVSLPLSVIDTGKLVTVESTEWDTHLKRKQLKSTATINLLSSDHCQVMEIDGALPVDDPVFAGHVPPNQVVAVIQPINFIPSATEKLDQKDIYKSNVEMIMEIKFKSDHLNDKHVIHIDRASPESSKGLSGLYFFPLRHKVPDLFKKAGAYIFSFSLIDSSCKSVEKRVTVKPSPYVEKWKPLSDDQNCELIVRVGSNIPTLTIGCYDIYDNQAPFEGISALTVKLLAEKGSLFETNTVKFSLSLNKLVLSIEDVLVKSKELDKIRPGYEATLVIGSSNELLSVSFACQVYPGYLENVELQPPITENQLRPGYVFEKLALEMFDAYGNHVLKGPEVTLSVDGFNIPDHVGMIHKVDDNGRIDLSGLLKVTAGYGRKASISVLFEGKTIFKQEFSIRSFQPDNIILHEKESPFNEERNFMIDNDENVQVPVAKTQNMVVECCQKPSPLNLIVQEQDSPTFDQEKNLLISLITNDEKDVRRIAEAIGEVEDVLDHLNKLKDKTEQEMYKLLENVEPQNLSSNTLILTKEELKLKIERMENTAASVLSLCCLSAYQKRPKCFRDDIIGLVVLCGTVKSPDLSRILAEYLGEDKMLAVICRSFDAASSLESYKQNGAVDLESGLHAEAATLGKAICNRFLVFCLEDIRPYTGCFQENDPQRKLALPDPILTNGKTPAGFIGYAVNMVEIDTDHLQIRTASGHSLRETVMFSLFRKLQVYETRESMMAACDCIEDDAVSLDGGILRENGLLSLGYGEPCIYFPCENQIIHSSETGDIAAQIKEKKEELMLIEEEFRKVAKYHKKCLKKFERKKAHYSNLLDRIELLESKSNAGNK